MYSLITLITMFRMIASVTTGLTMVTKVTLVTKSTPIPGDSHLSCLLSVNTQALVLMALTVSSNLLTQKFFSSEVLTESLMMTWLV